VAPDQHLAEFPELKVLLWVVEVLDVSQAYGVQAVWTVQFVYFS